MGGCSQEWACVCEGLLPTNQAPCSASRATSLLGAAGSRAAEPPAPVCAQDGAQPHSESLGVTPFRLPGTSLWSPVPILRNDEVIYFFCRATLPGLWKPFLCGGQPRQIVKLYPYLHWTNAAKTSLSMESAPRFVVCEDSVVIHGTVDPTLLCGSDRWQVPGRADR